MLHRLVNKKCSNTCSRLLRTNWAKTKIRHFAPSLSFSALKNKPKVPIREFQILLLREQPSLRSSWIIINMQKDNYNMLETFLPESILTNQAASETHISITSMDCNSNTRFVPLVKHNRNKWIHQTLLRLAFLLNYILEEIKCLLKKSTVHRTKQWQIANEQDQVFNLLRL